VQLFAILPELSFSFFSPVPPLCSFITTRSSLADLHPGDQIRSIRRWLFFPFLWRPQLSLAGCIFFLVSTSRYGVPAGFVFGFDVDPVVRVRCDFHDCHCPPRYSFLIIPPIFLWAFLPPPEMGQPERTLAFYARKERTLRRPYLAPPSFRARYAALAKTASFPRFFSVKTDAGVWSDAACDSSPFPSRTESARPRHSLPTIRQAEVQTFSPPIDFSDFSLCTAEWPDVPPRRAVSPTPSRKGFLPRLFPPAVAFFWVFFFLSPLRNFMALLPMSARRDLTAYLIIFYPPSVCYLTTP